MHRYGEIETRSCNATHMSHWIIFFSSPSKIIPAAFHGENKKTNANPGRDQNSHSSNLCCSDWNRRSGENSWFLGQPQYLGISNMHRKKCIFLTWTKCRSKWMLSAIYMVRHQERHLLVELNPWNVSLSHDKGLMNTRRLAHGQTVEATMQPLQKKKTQTLTIWGVSNQFPSSHSRFHRGWLSHAYQVLTCGAFQRNARDLWPGVSQVLVGQEKGQAASRKKTRPTWPPMATFSVHEAWWTRAGLPMGRLWMQQWCIWWIILHQPPCILGGFPLCKFLKFGLCHMMWLMIQKEGCDLYYTNWCV